MTNWLKIVLNTLITLWLFSSFPGIVIAAQGPEATKTASVDSDDRLILQFSPFIGGGKSSDQAQVRHTNGFRAALNWDSFDLMGLRMGPRFELSNTYVNSRFRGGLIRTSNYDHRIVNAGLTFSKKYGAGGWIKVPKEFRISAGGGYIMTKLSTDFTSDNLFRQYNQEEIHGNIQSAEFTTSFFIRDDFTLDLGFLASHMQIDQSSAIGTFEGESQTPSGTFLAGGSYDDDPSFRLQDTVWHKLYFGSIGVSVRF